MGIFQAREKDKNVTWLERAAIFQQEYNKLAAAEYYAGVAENQHMKLAQNFLNTPQSPEELEKTLNEKFPWRDTTGMGDWCRANILGDKSAKRNRKKYSRCREEYDKLGKPRGNFNINGDRPGFEGKVYDAFCPYMSQNDTQTPVDENININNIEEDHERFMARVDKRAEQAATQTQEKPK